MSENWYVYQKTLETKFDIIVLTEIGARNLSTIECLWILVYCTGK